MVMGLFERGYFSDNNAAFINSV